MYCEHFLVHTEETKQNKTETEDLVNKWLDIRIKSNKKEKKLK